MLCAPKAEPVPSRRQPTPQRSWAPNRGLGPRKSRLDHGASGAPPPLPLCPTEPDALDRLIRIMSILRFGDRPGPHVKIILFSHQLSPRRCLSNSMDQSPADRDRELWTPAVSRLPVRAAWQSQHLAIGPPGLFCFFFDLFNRAMLLNFIKATCSGRRLPSTRTLAFAFLRGMLYTSLPEERPK